MKIKITNCLQDSFDIGYQVSILPRIDIYWHSQDKVYAVIFGWLNLDVAFWFGNCEDMS